MIFLQRTFECRAERTVVKIHDWSLRNPLRLLKILCKLFYEAPTSRKTFSGYIKRAPNKLQANNFRYKQNIIKDFSNLLSDGNCFPFSPHKTKFWIEQNPSYTCIIKKHPPKPPEYKTEAVEVKYWNRWQQYWINSCTNRCTLSGRILADGKK